MTPKDEELIAAVFSMGFNLSRTERDLRDFMTNEKNVKAVNLLSEETKAGLRKKYTDRRDALRRANK